MNVWQILLLAVSANLDDLSVGFALGLRRSIPAGSMFIIGTISGLTMLTGVSVGGALRRFLVPGAAEALSAIIFAGFGIWFIREGMRRDRSRRTQPRRWPGSHMGDGSRVVRGGAAVGVGLGLGINSVALGISGGMVGFPPAATALVTGGTSLLFVFTGARFGAADVVRRLLGHRAEYLSGALMLYLSGAQIF